MYKKLLAALAVVAMAITSLAGTAAAAPRDGRCVAANLSALGGKTISAVANGSVDLGVSLSEAIQLHLDGELDLVGACD